MPYCSTLFWINIREKNINAIQTKTWNWSFSIWNRFSLIHNGHVMRRRGYVDIWLTCVLKSHDLDSSQAQVMNLMPFDLQPKKTSSSHVTLTFVNHGLNFSLLTWNKYILPKPKDFYCTKGVQRINSSHTLNHSNSSQSHCVSSRGRHTWQCRPPDRWYSGLSHLDVKTLLSSRKQMQKIPVRDSSWLQLCHRNNIAWYTWSSWFKILL